MSTSFLPTLLRITHAQQPWNACFEVPRVVKYSWRPDADSVSSLLASLATLAWRHGSWRSGNSIISSCLQGSLPGLAAPARPTSQKKTERDDRAPPREVQELVQERKGTGWGTKRIRAAGIGVHGGTKHRTVVPLGYNASCSDAGGKGVEGRSRSGRTRPLSGLCGSSLRRLSQPASRVSARKRARCYKVSRRRDHSARSRPCA